MKKKKQNQSKPTHYILIDDDTVLKMEIEDANRDELEIQEIVTEKRTRGRKKTKIEPAEIEDKPKPIACRTRGKTRDKKSKKY